MTSDPNSTRSIAKQFAEENSADHFDGFDGYMQEAFSDSGG